MTADHYPWSLAEEGLEVGMKLLGEIWGTEAPGDLMVPNMAEDKGLRRWHAKTSHSALSPRDAGRYLALLCHMDVRQILPAIRIPTLVMHRKDLLLPVEQSRYLAENIPEASLVVVPGQDSTNYTGPTAKILAAIEEFLTGASPQYGAGSSARGRAVHRDR